MKDIFNRWFNRTDARPGIFSGARSATANSDIFNVIKPDIFSETQMAIYGAKLANARQPFAGKSTFKLLARMAENEQQLIRCAATGSNGSFSADRGECPGRNGTTRRPEIRWVICRRDGLAQMRSRFMNSPRSARYR